MVWARVNLTLSPERLFRTVAVTNASFDSSAVVPCTSALQVATGFRVSLVLTWTSTVLYASAMLEA